MEQFKTTVTFLGTSTVVPAAGHDTASFLINGGYLMDTGWYSAIKMPKQIKVYVNGKLDGTFDHPNPIKATNANFYVGINPGGGDEFFNGVVDEVAVFHKDLSEKEILNLMAGFEKAGAAVLPAGKLTTAWGRIKSHL